MKSDRREERPKWIGTRPWRLGGLLGSSALWLVLLVGCQSGSDKAQDMPETAMRLRKLLVFLGDYIEITNKEATNKGQVGRPNEKGFQAHLNGLSKERLEADQITNLPELLLSPRDGKPFIINYSMPLGGPAPAIWEQTGVNGRRYLILVNGKVEELENERLEQILKK